MFLLWLWTFWRGRTEKNTEDMWASCFQTHNTAIPESPLEVKYLLSLLWPYPALMGTGRGCSCSWEHKVYREKNALISLQIIKPSTSKKKIYAQLSKRTNSQILQLFLTVSQLAPSSRVSNWPLLKINTELEDWGLGGKSCPFLAKVPLG